VGGEIYDRERGKEHGYRYLMSLSTFWSISGDYSSNYFQIDRQGRHRWVARFTYKLWRNLVYNGIGGADVSTRDDPVKSYGSLLHGPTLLVNVVRSVRNTPLKAWGQSYSRYATVQAEPGSFLDEDQPYGVNGGFYFDFSAGLFMQETDRWPVPNKGFKGELDVRGGGTAADGGFEPIVGVHAEAIGWVPLIGERLVLAGRTLIDKTWGEKPFFEGEYQGGLLRDENGYEQSLTGYARTRGRGDGISATLIELRAKLGDLPGRPAVGVYLSGYGEMAWLFEGNNPGPIMPTVGLAPTLLWQGAIQLRPFLSWGWFSDVQGGPRTPEAQFGISLFSPL